MSDNQEPTGSPGQVALTGQLELDNKSDGSNIDNTSGGASPSSAKEQSAEVPVNQTFSVVQSSDSRGSSRSPSKKPKTVAGFIADESSEDENDTATPDATAILQVPATNPRNRTRTPSPLHNVIAPADAVPEAAHSAVNNGNQASAPPQPATNATSGSTSTPHITTTYTAQPKARLPHDKMGILEDRIKEDPKGDLDAWMSLISEHRSRNKFEDARAAYERFLKIFPQAAEVWVTYIEMEIENDNFAVAESLFSRSLMTVPNVQLWSVYLNYIRRRNDLTNDPSGTARSTVSASYDFVLKNIGIDRDSGKIWQEYIQFVRSAPGLLGGSNWQDQQKMDQLRKAYQRAVTVPVTSVNSLWKEYDVFEMSLNKQTGRKYMQEKSPAYMSARSANTALENITRELDRSTLPKLAPALGFEGDQEFLQQVEIWKKWILWEQEDPLALKPDELDEYKKRVLYVFKQAVMTLRFWPETWLDAAEWCFNNGIEKDGDTFLSDGIAANPESCLLTFKKADRLESNFITEGAPKGPAEKGAIVRAPFDKLLNTLYDLHAQLKERESREIAKLEESSALDESINAIVSRGEDEDENAEADKKARDILKMERKQAIEKGYSSQTRFLSRTISFAWVALMRAMRRIQGKGVVKDPVGGARQIFADARARGKITSDVYVANALIEYNVYKDQAGTKIFERGAKLFPDDEAFILEYLKHLISKGDTTNARVAFETAVSRLTQKGGEFLLKTKPLYEFFHTYESQYGELAQIAQLEQRMAELFPDDPKLTQFASRFIAEGFDPTASRPIISPSVQMRPKTGLLQSIEKASSLRESPAPQYLHPQQDNSPRPQYVQAVNSPKRPFPTDDFDIDANRPRKLPRGESPLKGAAGRRLNHQKQLQASHGGSSWQSSNPPFVVPRDITFLLSIIPRPEFYSFTKFNAEALVRLLNQTALPDHAPMKVQQEQLQLPLPPPPQQSYGTSSSYNQPPPQENHSRPNGSQQYPGQGTNWGQVSDWTTGAESSPYQAAPYNQGYQAPGYPQERDNYSAPPQTLQGYPPTQPPAPQQSPAGWAQPPPLHSPVNGPPGTVEGGPYLRTSSNWYYPPANGAPPGYSTYGR